MLDSTSALAIARRYLARGWQPVPIPYQQKRPPIRDWQFLDINADNVEQYFSGQQNIGVQLGPRSHDLIDVDLDCAEALRLANHFLPKTASIFGRSGKPASHRLYYPDALPNELQLKAAIQYKDERLRMMLELRLGGGDKGAQTVFPGSVHQDTGELISWSVDGEPGRVPFQELKAAVTKIAVGVLLLRHWPRVPGSRHEAALAVGGFLARAGWTVNEIGKMVATVARTAGDDEVDDRERAAVDSADNLATGRHVYGLPKLQETFGDKVAKKIADFVGYSEAAGKRKPKTTSAKTLLIINDGDLPATAKELAELFVADDRLRSNGHRPVIIVVHDGMPRAQELTVASVRTLAHEICQPVTQGDKNELFDTTLSEDLAGLYLFGLEGRWGLKTFRGITTAPVLGEDGTIRAPQGYDAESGLFCHQIPELKVPERPSEADARAALQRLRHRFRTFPFADSERIIVNGQNVTDLHAAIGLDESGFLVALLTAVVRQSLDLAPGYLCDAPSISGSGSGKGLLIKAMVIIGSGARPVPFTAGHNKEEFDKRLTAALIEARTAVFLDNFNGKDLRSDILESALTEEPVMVRALGHSKNVPLYTRTFICITGNGVQIALDMARRLLRTVLDAKVENPEQRKFAPGFLARVLADRPRLLSDALTIWRWGRQTQPEAGLPLGSYETWALWCRDPLLALGCQDPVKRIAETKAADPHRAKLVAIFDAWWFVHKDRKVEAADLDESVVELIDDKATRGEGGKLHFNRQFVARFLARHAGTRVGGYVLEQTKDTTLTRPIAAYRLLRPEPA
jgi:hypothetical protein